MRAQWLISSRNDQTDIPNDTKTKSQADADSANPTRRRDLLVLAQHENSERAKGIKAGDLLDLVVVQVKEDQTF